MCEECGCGEPQRLNVEVDKNILSEVERAAQHNREHLDKHRVLGVELLGSPGAGKTSLIEALLGPLSEMGLGVSVIEGDIETQRDAERIRAKGAWAFQLTTGGACHLSPELVHGAMAHLPWDTTDILFIENVGNLVCPADFPLGAHLRLVVLSVPEGDDKAPKYPRTFRVAQGLIINKADLIGPLDFDPERLRREALSLNPFLKVFLVSAKTGQGIPELARWLAEQRPG